MIGKEIPNWVLSNLCYRDKRNPDCIDEVESAGGQVTNCFCDNCFYGRTVLAEYIVNIYEEFKPNIQFVNIKGKLHEF